MQFIQGKNRYQSILFPENLNQIVEQDNEIRIIDLFVESTKLRAQNSQKNNFNPKKIERHLAYSDNKLDEYNQALEAADDQNKIIINQAIDKQNERKVFTMI